MYHVLDNPAWNALISGNSYLAKGNERARFFDINTSPFAALAANTDENFRELHNITPPERIVLFATPHDMAAPPLWDILSVTPAYQMVHNGELPAIQPTIQLTPLVEEHIPQMLTLTSLTNPGPFGNRTIDFGHYRGVFDGDKLVAMAGQRLHAFNYQEVSAVCTHPNYVGKGYARQLLLWHVHRILIEGGTPYLHVRNDNYRAIKVYEDLGFAVRIPVKFYVLRKQ